MIWSSRTAVVTAALVSGLGVVAAGVGDFVNPILPGFHPDPSCIFEEGEGTFYCASSSFNVFPGIPIHASKDLKKWRLVGELAHFFFFFSFFFWSGGVCVECKCRWGMQFMDFPRLESFVYGGLF